MIYPWIAAIIGASAIVLYILNLFQARKREKEERAAAEQHMRLGEIRTFQAELGKLTKESTRTTQEFKDAKAEYEARWRKPGSDDSSGGKPSGS